jgi:ubiquitin-protein ligase
VSSSAAAKKKKQKRRKKKPHPSSTVEPELSAATDSSLTTTDLLADAPATVERPQIATRSNDATTVSSSAAAKKKQKRRKKKAQPSSTVEPALSVATDSSLTTTDLLADAPAIVERPQIATRSNNAKTASSSAAKKKKQKKRKRKEQPSSTVASDSCVETIATDSSIDAPAATVQPSQSAMRSKDASSVDAPAATVQPSQSATCSKDASSVDAPAATVQPSQSATRSKDASSVDAPAATVQPSKSATSTRSKNASTASTATVTPLSREAASSLRRIQGEWKDAVQAGIAFDWKKGKPVRRRRRHATGTVEQNPQDQQQHVWLGPLSKNIWIWHFSVTGVPGSVFGDGIYHGRIVLPSSYPAQPPRIQVWTASGRFIPRADICLSASSYHPESWTASWTIRTLVEALRLHMLTPAQEIGGMNQNYDQRLAKVVASRSWRCRVSPSVVVDHAQMVAQGLFPAVVNEPSEQLELSSSLSSSTKPTEATVEIARKVTMTEPNPEWIPPQRRQSSSPTTIPVRSEAEKTLPVVPSLLMSLHRTLVSPVRLTLLGFAILFFVLNRP